MLYEDHVWRIRYRRQIPLRNHPSTFSRIDLHIYHHFVARESISTERSHLFLRSGKLVCQVGNAAARGKGSQQEAYLVRTLSALFLYPTVCSMVIFVFTVHSASVQSTRTASGALDIGGPRFTTAGERVASTGIVSALCPGRRHRNSCFIVILARKSLLLCSKVAESKGERIPRSISPSYSRIAEENLDLIESL